MIKREVLYSFNDKELEHIIGNNQDYDQFITFCIDICCKEGLSATRADVSNWIYYIANEGRFNSVKHMLESFHSKYNIQSGDSGEFEKFMECITFKNNDAFSEVLFLKALWQSVAMIHNENGEYGADGALTMQGNQGIGKTSILRKMCECFDSKYFKEGAEFNKVSIKDDVLQNTGYFICELGEAGSSLNQVDWLKRFITNPVDEVRPPYGMKAKKTPRFTSFYLTVNDTEFLKDNENRRYWTVQIADIKLNELNKVNFEKVWAEVYQMYLDNAAGFRLTVFERQTLKKINEEFRILTKEEQVIRDCYDWKEPQESWKEKTATEVATEVFNTTCLSISPHKIGNALSNLGYSKESKDLPKRILHGINLYLMPKPHPKIETGQPFDKKDAGKVIPMMK